MLPNYSHSAAIGRVASNANDVNPDNAKTPAHVANNQFHSVNPGVSPNTALYTSGAIAAPTALHIFDHPIIDAVYFPPTSCA